MTLVTEEFLTVDLGKLVIQRQDVGVAHLVTLFGNLDRDTADAFVEFVELLSNDPSRVVHLDLGNLRVVDLTALAAIDGLISERADSASPVHVLIPSAAMKQLRQLISGIPR